MNKPVQLGEASKTWTELQAGGKPSGDELTRYNEAIRNSLVQVRRARKMEDGVLLKTTEGEVKLAVKSLNVPGFEEADEMLPADVIKIRQGLNSVAQVKGVGAPLIIRQARSAEDPMIPESGMWIPVTALLNMDERDAPVLELMDPVVSNQVTFAGNTFPLAADYSSSFARDFNDRQDLLKGLSGLLSFEKFADRLGVCRVTPFYPEKEVCVFIHGINSSPATWAKTINRLYADPEIRARYEFWTFGYPSGAVIPYLAAECRDAVKEMLVYRAGRGATNQKVTIVGHSMGGLLAKALTFSSGDTEWNELFRVPIDELNVSDKDRETLRHMLYFEPIPEIERVIFCAVPHRGSSLANNPGIKLVADLVEVPTQLLFLSTGLLTQGVEALTPRGIEFIRDRFNSIGQLSREAWTTAEFLNKPLNPAVTYHSIIGRSSLSSNDVEKSSDGVVPYRSSHIDGVASELVIPSNHSVHQKDEGIEEIRRILTLP